MNCFIKFSNKRKSAFGKIYNLEGLTTYVGPIVSVMKELKIKNIHSIDDQRRINFECEDGFCSHRDINHKIVVYSLSQISGISVSDLLKTLYDINPCFSVDYYTMKGREFDNGSPYFLDGGDEISAWSLTIPSNAPVELLAEIISHYFVSIGGYIMHGDKKIVYFMKEENKFNHCISYKAEKYAQDESGEKVICLLPGLQGLFNVPFETQVAACAIVAEISYEEMLEKINKVSE